MNIDILKVTELVKSTQSIITDLSLASDVTVKGKADYVTRVDTTVQRYLSERLAELYPKIQFLGEEGHADKIDFSECVWILDPVDGTTNLIHGYNQSAVSLGLISGGESVFGIVFNPFAHEIFTAQKGSGAFLNGNRISVSSVADMERALISVGTSPYYKKEYAQKNFEIFMNIFNHAEDIRRTGSAAIDLCNVACGRIEAYFEHRLKPWDYAAGTIIVGEAGGRVTTMDGECVMYSKNCDIIAANSKLYDTVMHYITGR